MCQNREIKGKKRKLRGHVACGDQSRKVARKLPHLDYSMDKGKKKENEKNKRRVGANKRENVVGKNVGRREKNSEREEEKGRKEKRRFFWYFDGSRRKVYPRNGGYVWVSKSWSFVKLHEVENFSTLNISSLKII